MKISIKMYLLAVLIVLSSCHNLTKKPNEDKQAIPTVPVFTSEQIDSILSIAEVKRQELMVKRQREEELKQRQEEELRLKQEQRRKQETSTIIGIWADDFTKGHLWRIRLVNDERYILELGEVNSNRWIFPHQLVKVQKNGYAIYYDVSSDYEEYYQVEKNGNLSVFDNWGYIATYKKVKFN